jgi:hypothetical protein
MLIRVFARNQCKQTEIMKWIIKYFLEDTHTGTNDNSPCSEVTNKVYEDIVVREDGHDTSMSIRNQGECSSVDTEERERETRELGLTPIGLDSHVSFKLWKLSKDEGHTDDWKEGFLKGNQNNREVNILVRRKLDGCEIKGNKIQRFCIVPKIEYQTDMYTTDLKATPVNKSSL